MRLTKAVVIMLLHFTLLYYPAHTAEDDTDSMDRGRISYGDSPPVGKYKFVGFVKLHYCEKILEIKQCKTRPTFTVTLISHSHMLTSSQYIPCVIRHRILMGKAATDKFTFSNVTFEFNFGQVDTHKHPYVQVQSNYPKDMDIILHTYDLKIPEKVSKMFCPIESDLAMLRLFVHIIHFDNEFVKPIPILKMPISTKVRKDCVALSYNFVEDLKVDGKLHSAFVTYGDVNYCKKLDNRTNKYFEKPYMICSKGVFGKIEVCGPDTGSPLVCGSEHWAYYLVGILSITDDPKPNGQIYCGKTKTHYAMYNYPGFFEKEYDSQDITLITQEEADSLASRIANDGNNEQTSAKAEKNSTSGGTSLNDYRRAMNNWMIVILTYLFCRHSKHTE